MPAKTPPAWKVIERTFDLSDFDELGIAFLNRKGETLHSVFFHRPRERGKENPDLTLTVGFTSFDQKAKVVRTRFEAECRAKDAPRATEARKAELSFKLANYNLQRQLYINVIGKDGLRILRFRWAGFSEQANVDVDDQHGNGYCLTIWHDE